MNKASQSGRHGFTLLRRISAMLIGGTVLISCAQPYANTLAQTSVEQTLDSINNTEKLPCQTYKTITRNDARLPNPLITLWTRTHGANFLQGWHDKVFPLYDGSAPFQLVSLGEIPQQSSGSLPRFSCVIDTVSSQPAIGY